MMREVSIIASYQGEARCSSLLVAATTADAAESAAMKYLNNLHPWLEDVRVLNVSTPSEGCAAFEVPNE